MSLLDIFRPKWRSADPEVRQEAVIRIEDQGQLRKVFDSTEHQDVRLAVMTRLTAMDKLRADSETWLARVAKSSEYKDLRSSATELIRSDDILLKLAEETSDECPATKKTNADKQEENRQW